jgi:glycosyltransferase involved in cell wall biosynthesis
MLHDMKVSIVLPVYKPKRQYLEDLFKSIEEQTFQDFDMIISDDADDQEMISDTLPLSLRDRTKYIRNEGQHGIFSNLNHAIRHATGEFIQILCQDDILLPELLAANQTGLDQYPKAVMAFSHFDFVDATGIPMKFYRWDLHYIPSIMPSSEANNFYLYFGCMPGNLSPVMLRHTTLQAAGYFDEHYKFAGDYEFWIRVAKFGDIFFDKRINLYIRDHDDRASGMLGTFERFKELRPILRYLMQHNSIPVEEHILRRYLHVHIFRCVVSYTARKVLTLKRVDWRSIKQIFDGKPYSFWYGFLSFLQPMPKICIPMKKFMEVKRS